MCQRSVKQLTQIFRPKFTTFQNESSVIQFDMSSIATIKIDVVLLLCRQISEEEAPAPPVNVCFGLIC